VRSAHVLSIQSQQSLQLSALGVMAEHSPAGSLSAVSGFMTLSDDSSVGDTSDTSVEHEHSDQLSPSSEQVCSPLDPARELQAWSSEEAQFTLGSTPSSEQLTRIAARSAMALTKVRVRVYFIRFTVARSS
jgi:hypothetical protein